MRHAGVLFCVSIVLCSGCGTSKVPIVVNTPACPTPSAPALPLLDAAEPLDSPKNIERLLERDDRLRTYIDGLKAALCCEQARGKEEDGK